jgi:hypothetical protein
LTLDLSRRTFIAAGAACTTLAQARAAIAGFDLRPLATRVVSAHVMGGAALGADPRRAVVDVNGRHHHLANLYVVDGSLFPSVDRRESAVLDLRDVGPPRDGAGRGDACARVSARDRCSFSVIALDNPRRLNVERACSLHANRRQEIP